MARGISIARFELLGNWHQSGEFRENFAIRSAYAIDDMSVIAAIYFFRPHNGFTYLLMVADSSGRYRHFFTALPLWTARAAEAALHADLEVIENGTKPAPVIEPVEYGVDLFAPNLAKDYNDKFLNLRDKASSSATRAAMTEVARWYDDRDGNFVKDFQTTGYDARLWELYLFAAFSELGFSMDKEKAVPDFRLSKGEKKIFVEAVTANPKQGQHFDLSGFPPPPPEDFAHYIEHEMPQKFGSPLRTKVLKEYWKDPNVSGEPFLLAIADFHAPASMTWSHTALSFYLYGVGVELRPDHPDYKSMKEKRLGDHVVGEKVVPTNFFGQEAHRHVSGIMFSNAATNAKFNRMGVLAGLGSTNVRLVRRGGLYDHTPGSREAVQFEINVEDPEYEEKWSDELEIYHNPLALHPLDPDLFPSLTHFYLKDNELVWHGPERRVLYSTTQVLEFTGKTDVDDSEDLDSDAKNEQQEVPNP